MHVGRSIKYKFLVYVMYRSMQGRDSCRLDPATLIQGQKYAVNIFGLHPYSEGRVQKL